MISSNRITRAADRDDVDAKTVERDYVLTQVLIGIARQPGAKQMVFKGGTALRLCYFEDYRYSADLDFSLLDGMSLNAARAAVESALSEVAADIGFPHLAVSADGKQIEYVGPLGSKPRSLKLDLAEDELVESIATRPLVKRYEDQPDCEVLVYGLDEVGAEKLRCVIQRLQARDLFDLHELFVLNHLQLEETWPAFERKARHKNIDPERWADAFEKRMPQWRDRWEGEMLEHVPLDLPEFKAIERAVRRAFRSRL